MIARIIYLTIRHYLATIILLILVYVIFVAYFHVNETVLFLLTVLLTWLQPMIDKVREIKRQVELEPRPPNEAIRPISTRHKINWGLIVSKTRTPLLIIFAIIVLFAFAIYIYLFVRLRHWP